MSGSGSGGGGAKRGSEGSNGRRPAADDVAAGAIAAATRVGRAAWISWLAT